MGTLGGLALAACAGATTRGSGDPIRVGAATNHPPYSERVRGLFVGVDVDLIRDFANTIDRTVVFDAIEWSTLVSDMSSDRFDLAVGGIHVTPARQAAASFSTPYVNVRNAALVQCNEVTRFVESVNAWIARRQADGLIQAVFASHSF